MSVLSSTARMELLAGDPGGLGYSDDLPLGSRFFQPLNLAYDGAGSLYVADLGNHLIRRVLVPSGRSSRIAGQAGRPGSADGIKVAAQFNSPTGLALDGKGGLYVADTLNCTIRYIVLTSGQVTTVAGAPGQCGHADGVGTAARFWQPRGLAIDAAGTQLYIVDLANHVIRRMALDTLQVTTLAGMPGSAGAADGIGSAARFNQPSNLTLDGAGSLFVSDSGNCTIRRIDLASTQVSTFVGAANWCESADGVGNAARIRNPGALSVGAGLLYVADTGNHVIRTVNLATRQVTTWAGASGTWGAIDGTRAVARFYNPSDALFVNGGLYVADAGNHVIRSISRIGVVSTLSGDLPSPGNSDGTGRAARFTLPRNLTTANGSLYLADQGTHTVRRIDPTSGQTTTIAGNAATRGCSDGVGTGAQLRTPFGLASDGSQRLFVSEFQNHTIRRIDLATQTVTTVAGACGIQSSADGVCSAARFSRPLGLAYDKVQNRLYVADEANHTIRSIDFTYGCYVTTVAGTAGVYGATDGSLASALFNRPSHIEIGGKGTVLYVTDAENYSIRRIDLLAGQVTTIAGSADEAGCLDGYGPSARFSAFGQMRLDDDERYLYVNDLGNHTLRQIDLAYPHLVLTIAGRCSQAGFRQGTLNQAVLNLPAGLTSYLGRFYLTDVRENIVVRISGL